jgi:AcrR family transcriptional regulator
MELPKNIIIQINDKIYLRNPESSQLGQRIIKGSIELIDEIGFENFTFKKLGQHIESPEASVYRYFENKHKVLLYLTSWYWTWMDYRVLFATANIPSPSDRLEKALDVLTLPIMNDEQFEHIDESKLLRIVSSESSKAYLIKEVDDVNQEGLYSGYKQLVSRVSSIVSEINPNFPYPEMLISTVIEGTHHQRYFSEHLPRLTNCIEGEDSVNVFYKKMTFSIIDSQYFTDEKQG